LQKKCIEECEEPVPFVIESTKQFANILASSGHRMFATVADIFLLLSTLWARKHSGTLD